MDEDNGEDQEDGEGNIHCVGEETGKSFLTQQDYEESLMIQQTEDDLLGDGIFTAEDKNRYNLRSKSNAAQADASVPPTEIVAHVNQKAHTSEDQPAKSSKEKASAPPKKIAVPVNQKTHTSEDQPANPSKEKASAPPKKIVVPVSQQTPENQPPVEQQKNQEAPSVQVKNYDKTADKAPYSFNFVAELQKIKIPIPLVELMKNEMFKKDILKTLDP